jgi:hypothetical protein
MKSFAANEVPCQLKNGIFRFAQDDVKGGRLLV